jgi:hypothetical protein
MASCGCDISPGNSYFPFFCPRAKIRLTLNPSLNSSPGTPLPPANKYCSLSPCEVTKYIWKTWPPASTSHPIPTLFLKSEFRFGIHWSVSEDRSVTFNLPLKPRAKYRFWFHSIRYKGLGPLKYAIIGLTCKLNLLENFLASITCPK